MEEVSFEIVDQFGTDIAMWTGTAMADVIVGLDGIENRMLSFGGDDVLRAGAGGNRHTIEGGDGNDSIFGGSGDDSFNGGAGADLMIGGAGMTSMLSTM